jgi:hypothetical protein
VADFAEGIKGIFAVARFSLGLLVVTRYPDIVGVLVFCEIRIINALVFLRVMTENRFSESRVSVCTGGYDELLQLNAVIAFIIFIKPLPMAVGRVKRFYREG